MLQCTLMLLINVYKKIFFSNICNNEYSNQIRNIYYYVNYPKKLRFRVL